MPKDPVIDFYNYIEVIHMKIKILIPALLTSVITFVIVLTSNAALAGLLESREAVQFNHNLKINKSGSQLTVREPRTMANNIVIPRGKGFRYAKVLRKKYS